MSQMFFTWYMCQQVPLGRKTPTEPLVPRRCTLWIMFVTHIPLASPVQMGSWFNLVPPDWQSPPAWGQVALLRFLLISSSGSSGVLYMGSQPSACPRLSFSCNALIPVLDTDCCYPCHADFKVSYSFITRWSTDTDLLLNSSQLHWNQISACFFFFFSFN